MMKQDNGGPFGKIFSLDNGTGRFLKDELEHVPLLDAARRFSCVFLSTSAKDAVRLNQHLSAAGIRAYHAGDTREAEMLLAITSARILLVDIDRTIEPWPEILQKLDESHSNVPKVLLTARTKCISSLILSDFALDVVPKPAYLGDLLCALEWAHSVEQELNDPEIIRAIEMRVLVAIRSAAQQEASKHLHR
jgi:DNA-binding response OmpR family regulator